MSRKQVLNNITHFLKTILPEASCSNKWTKESIQDAFSWAEYCKQIHDNVIDKPVEKVFNSQIEAIGEKIEGGESDICLEYLNYSTELLFKAFLQNEFIGHSIQQFIYDEAKQKQLDIDKLTDEVRKAKALCDELINSPNLILDSGINYISIVDEVKAEFLLDIIKNKVNCCTTQPQIEQSLFEFLLSFLKTKDEIACFLQVLLLKTEEYTQDHLIQKIILRYICDRINTHGDWVGQNIWKLSCGLLGLVASKHCAFYKFYVKMLVDSAQQMIQTFKDDMLVWRMRYSPNLENVTFDELCNHFLCLVQLQTKAGKSTTTLLQCLANNPKESVIWKDIFELVNEMKNTRYP